MKRRQFFAMALVPIATMMKIGAAVAQPAVTVFKVKTCGCCGKWVEHLRTNGFDVKVQEVSDNSEYRHRYGVPDKLQSCHTAIVDGYAIEGHVPASDIQRFLRERPKAKGLAVPNMPAGSPGMEGSGSEAYSVFIFDDQGRSSVYQNYPRR